MDDTKDNNSNEIGMKEEQITKRRRLMQNDATNIPQEVTYRYILQATLDAFNEKTKGRVQGYAKVDLLDKVAKELASRARVEKQSMIVSGRFGRVELSTGILGHIASFCNSRTCQNDFSLACVATHKAVRSKTLNNALQWPTKLPLVTLPLQEQLSISMERSPQDGGMPPLVKSLDGSKIAVFVNREVVNDDELHTIFRLEIWDRLKGLHQTLYVKERAYAHMAYAHTMRISPDMTTAARVVAYENIYIYDVHAQAHVGTLWDFLRSHKVYSGFMFQDDNTFLLVSHQRNEDTVCIDSCSFLRDATRKIIGCTTPKLLLTVTDTDPQTDPVHFVKSPWNTMLCIRFFVDRIMINDIQRGTVVERPQPVVNPVFVPRAHPPNGWLDSCAFSCDGRKLIVATREQGLKVCDIIGDSIEAMGHFHCIHWASRFSRYESFTGVIPSPIDPNLVFLPGGIVDVRNGRVILQPTAQLTSKALLWRMFTDPHLSNLKL